MSLSIEWIRSRRGQDPMTFLDDVFRYALARLGQREEAEDIAIEVVQALPSPCYRRDLRPYMIGMARRKIADRLRKSRPPQVLLERDATDSFAAEADESAMVDAIMKGLSEEHREVLTLKYVIGLSSNEIGSLTGKRSTAVDSMLQRARDAFAEAWTRTTSDEVKL
jgi:RNA polymerase sigma-70 factor, ECF subfamily